MRNCRSLLLVRISEVSDVDLREARTSSENAVGVVQPLVCGTAVTENFENSDGEPGASVNLSDETDTEGGVPREAEPEPVKPKTPAHPTASQGNVQNHTF